MRTARLGSRGPELSVVGLGGWEAGGLDWGPNVSEEAVIVAVLAALDAGIDWIDTAEVYGDGVSESLVGRAVAARRDQVLLASKVAPLPEGSGFRPEQIRAACHASLRRLGTDRIDLYQLHWPDGTGVPLEDSWAAMAELQDGGEVRFLGASNFDRDRIEACEAIRHVDSLQQELSLLNTEHMDLIRWCGERGTGVVAYGPLAFGLLTGSVTTETRFVEGDWRGTETDGMFADLQGSVAIVDRMRPIAARLGVTLAQLALAWNVAQPGVTSAIAGSRNPDHVRENAAAADLDLDRATLAELGALVAS